MKSEAAFRECLKQIQETLLSNVLAAYECGDIDHERLEEEDCPYIHDLCLVTLRLADEPTGYDEAMASITELMEMKMPKNYSGTRWLSMLAAVVEAWEKENFPMDEDAMLRQREES